MKKSKVRLVSAMEKVFASKEPTGEGSTKNIVVMRGETVSFQIAYYWEGLGREDGRVEIVSPIKDYIKVRCVKLVPCEYPCHMQRDEDYLITEPGLYPDLLTEIPDRGFPIINGQWRSLWVDIDADEEIKSGDYKIAVKLSVDESTMGEIEVQCKVLRAVLPPLPIRHTEWLHTDCLANYYKVEVFSEQYWQIVKKFVRTAAKRNCNMILTPIFTPPLDTVIGGERLTVQLVDVKEENESYTFRFDNFEKWVKICKESGIEYFEMSHLFTQWGALAAPKIMAEKDGRYQKIFGWETSAAGGEYEKFLRQFLPELKKEIKRLGIEKKVYFHVSDEPRMSDLESYRAAKGIVKDYLEEFEIFDALSDYEFYKENLVKQPVCAIDHIEPFLKERPQKLWGYYCTSQSQKVSNRFIAQPSYRTRIIGAQLYKYKLDGFLHWGYNFYNAQYSLFAIDPYQCTDAGGAFPSGDPFLVYPGKGGEPEESIRMMMMNAAMNDVRAMYFLERLEGRDRVMKCIECGPEEKVEFDDYPKSIQYIENYRTRINQAIESSINKSWSKK